MSDRAIVHLSDPTFPPRFAGHAAPKGTDAQGEATRRAATGDLGAGDLVWSRNTAKADCALVLEPEVSLARACQMAALAAVAMTETLGALCPPQVAVEFRWPDTILVNGGAAGRIRLATPRSTPDTVPAFLVVALTLDLTAEQRHEPGETKDVTSLAEEGAAHVTRTDVIEALAPRLLSWLHTWGEDGFRPIHDQWLFRAAGRTSDITIDGKTGRVAGLDEDGNLLLRTTAGRVETLPYLPHVEAAS